MVFYRKYIIYLYETYNTWRLFSVLSFFCGNCNVWLSLLNISKVNMWLELYGVCIEKNKMLKNIPEQIYSWAQTSSMGEWPYFILFWVSPSSRPVWLVWLWRDEGVSGWVWGVWVYLFWGVCGCGAVGFVGSVFCPVLSITNQVHMFAVLFSFLLTCRVSSSRGPALYIPMSCIVLPN